MAIDGCSHTFATLAAEVLPQRMAEMRLKMQTPLSMADFAKAGTGIKTHLRRLGLQEDVSGCYVLLDGQRPFYVGISQHVITRLVQHVKGRTHFDASLAYRMACKQCPHESTREDAMTQPLFQQAFAKAKGRLASMQVAFLPISSPVELCLFEVYCAVELDTGDWNTFQTH